MNIYYLGPVGSYSEIVAKKVFGQDHHSLVPVERFKDIVEKVKKDGRGILGIENSTSSSVHESIDCMFQSDLFIIAEVSMNIHLHMGGVSNALVHGTNHVYSHSQALAQCSDFISKHHLLSHKTSSTAAAIDEVVQLHDLHRFAIGDRSSIIKCGLAVVFENIENTQNNMTRWIIISRKPESLRTPINKVTYAFRIKHEPGSLARVLQCIAQVQGNMTKIESRPVPGSNWEYEFWVDVDIPEGSVKQIDQAIKRATSTYRRIGAYQKGKVVY